MKARRLLLQPGASSGSLLTPAEEDDRNKILNDPDAADSTLGPAHAILIDMECLSILNKLPETVESLNSDLQKQLSQILCRIATADRKISSGWQTALASSFLRGFCPASTSSGGT